MSVVGPALLYGFYLYAAVGIAVAVAFVVKGVTAVQHAPVTVPARLLFVPAAAALWPWVLRRWLRARSPA